MVPGPDELLVDYSSIPVVNADHGASSCASSSKLTDVVHKSIVSSIVSFRCRLIYAYLSSSENLLSLYLYIYSAVHLSFSVLRPGYVVFCCEKSNPLHCEPQSKTSMTEDYLCTCLQYRFLLCSGREQSSPDGWVHRSVSAIDCDFLAVRVTPAGRH